MALVASRFLLCAKYAGEILLNKHFGNSYNPKIGNSGGKGSGTSNLSNSFFFSPTENFPG